MAPAKRQKTSTSSPTASGNATTDARDPQPARADCDSSAPDADLVAEPEELLCPITRIMFRDPVMVVESGHTYERSAVLTHFERDGAKDPITGRDLSSTKVMTNRTVRQIVQAWLDRHPDVTPDGGDSRELLEPSEDDGIRLFDGEIGQHWPGDRPGAPARGPRPPREKGGRGGGARATAAVGSMDKNARAVHQISLLTRGEDGKVVLPVGPIHGVTLESLGAVQPPDAPGFHSAAYILPVGYRTTRQYMRCDDPNGPRTRWVQEIVRGEGDDEGKPLFRLTADE